MLRFSNPCRNLYGNEVGLYSKTFLPSPDFTPECSKRAWQVRFSADNTAFKKGFTLISSERMDSPVLPFVLKPRI